MKRTAPLILILLLTSGTCLVPSQSRSAENSHVIGCITGTYQPLPLWFKGSESLARQGIEDIEFRGFSLKRKEDGKKYSIYPNRQGYFHQPLPEGVYSLVRERRDKPRWKEEKTIEILTIDVLPGSLVNLGTLDIVLDGKPTASFRSLPWGPKGTYVYRYRYSRRSGEDAYRQPLQWFRNRKPGIAEEFLKRTQRVEAIPTTAVDSSKVVLQEREIPVDN